MRSPEHRKNWLPVLLLAFACLPFGGASAFAMTFSLQQLDVPSCRPNCPAVVVATGEIYLSDYQKMTRLLVEAAGQRRIAPVLLINSPGGQSGGGLIMGQLVRRLGVTVIVGQAASDTSVVAGYCNSACTFVLMGGKKRIVPRGSRVGIHWYREAPRMQDIVNGGELGSASDPDAFEKMIRDYARSMGVNQSIAAHMRRVPHDSVHVLSRDELRRYRLATAQ